MPLNRRWPVLLSLALGFLFTSQAASPTSLTNEHQRWLEQEVVYIISEEERRDFLQQEGREARERLIQDFWRIRDPDPSTEVNEYREIHYQRIQEASRKFQDGMPGWKTDRGRIFIMHGPPDDVSFTFGGDGLSVDIINPTEVIVGAGNQDRRKVYRLELVRPETEIWVYRHLEGAGHHSGPFQIIFSRTSPIELVQLHQTIRGLGGGVNAPYPTRLARDTAIMHFYSSQQVTGRYQILYAGEYKFPDIDTFYRSIFHPNRTPSFNVHDFHAALRDLERSPGEVLQEKLRRGRRLREQVGARISFEHFEMDVRFGSIRAESGGTLVPITLGIDPGFAGDELDVLLELVRPDGTPAATLVDSLQLRRSERKAGSEEEPLLYQSRLAARPGPYQLRVYGFLKNRESVYFGEHPVNLPDYSEEGVSMSDVLLFDKVMPRREIRELERSRFLGGSRPILLEQHALVPAADANFRRKERLTAFVEVYNPALGDGQREPALNFKCRLWQGEQLVANLPDRVLDYFTLSRVEDKKLRRTAYGLTLPLQRLRPGLYSLELEVHDPVAQQTVSRRADFRVY